MSLKDTIIICIIVALISIPICWFVVIDPIMQEMDVEGTVTDKFITHDFRGDPEFYFVLDGTKTVYTVEKYYYSLEIGEYYDPFPWGYRMKTIGGR